MNVETIAEQLFFTTVLIQAEAQDGSVAIGTGFIYQVDVSDDRHAAFLVTNRHVIEAAQKVVVRFCAADDDRMQTPKLGASHTVTIATPDDAFIAHPDKTVDVAVAPVSGWVNALHGQGNYVFYRALSPSIALTRENVGTLDALEDVVFVGYPNGLYDTKHLVPLARRGVTATPLALDYNGTPCFLIDASVFPGSSGSPVLLFQTGGYATRDGGFAIGGRIVLLGIVAAVYQRDVPVLSAAAASGPHVKDTLNIGIVYKMSAVDELIDSVLADSGLSRHTVNVPQPVVDPEPSDDAVSASDKSA